FSLEFSGPTSAFRVDVGAYVFKQGALLMSNQVFRNLHDDLDILLLLNAWDAGSARLIESLGAKAIATTSAGLAWSRGYPDGDALPIEQLFSAARDIARVIRVPLTIDIEG